MNEEFLNHIYNTLYKDKTDYNTFKKDFVGNEDFIKHTFDKLGYANKGITLDKFKSDLNISPNNVSQNTTASTSSSASGAIDHSKVKNYIGELESDNTYTAANKSTSARGKYQHMWSEHGNQIAQVTGIKDEATYLKSPEAQEKYQDYLQPMYEKQLPKLRKIAIEQGKDYSDDELMYLIHHSWIGNAEKFLKGQDVPDKAGLESALAKGREKGLTVPRNVTNKLIVENTDFVSVNGLLPTRDGKEFKSPIDKRIVDKLSGFMEDHGLVVTDTNDTKIHKSSAQNSGKSLDVNFDDRTLDPNKVKAAIIDGQKRGLKLQFEIKDKRVYDQYIKTRPDLKDHILHVPGATGNHFSVYHGDNMNYDKNLLSSSKQIPKDRLIEIKSVKARITGAARKAAPKEALDELKKKPSLSDAANPLVLIPGATGVFNAGKKALFSEEEQYRKAAAYMFQTGQLKVEDFTNEELAEIYNVKAEIADLNKQAVSTKKRLDDQLKDKGFLEGVGDFFAGGVLDQIVGGITGGAADRLDTQDGKININAGDFTKKARYLTPEEILNLKVHPEAKNPNNPNDTYTKYLRKVQKTLTAGDSLEFDAKTKADSLRREFAGSRLGELEKEINKIGGKDTLKKLNTLSEKLQNETITEQEQQQLQALQQKLEDSGGLLTQWESQAKQYNGANDAIKAVEGKYGIVTKIRALKEEDQAKFDDLDRRMSWIDKTEQSISNILSSFGNGIADMAGATVNAVGGLAEAATGTNMGFTESAKRRGQVQVDTVKSTKSQRGVLETSMEIDGYTAVFQDNKVSGIYDKDGYKVNNESVAKKAQEELDNKYKGKQSELGWLDNTSFNFTSLLQGVEDNTPQLAQIAMVGAFGKAVGAAATSTIANAATSGSRVANIARVLTKPLQSARGIEASSMVPVFIKDTVDQAIADGAITPGQIYGTATVNLIRESLAESMFAGPIGKMLSGKGVSKAIFNKSLSEKLNDVVKHYATGKITAADFMGHMGKATVELLKDAGGEFVEEAVIEWSNGITNEFLNASLGTNYDEKTATGKEVFSAGLIGMGAGSVMGGMRMVSNVVDYKSGIAESYKNVLSDVVGQTSASLVKGETVANPEAFKEYLSAAVAEGQIDQKDADKYSAAIQSAANRTKFTNDIDVSTGMFKDLRDKRGLDAREKFINLARNVAFNKSLTETIEPTNQFAEEIQTAKVNSYENILKELELNAHRTVYSSSTPTSVGNQRGLNSDQVNLLRARQASILDEVNGTKLNAVNKAKAVELKLNEAANTILKSKETISDKEKAELEIIDDDIKALQADLDKANAEQEARAAVEVNSATPEQIELVDKKAVGIVEDWFKDFTLTYDTDGNAVIPATEIESMLTENPEVKISEKALELVQEKIANLKGEEYVKKAEKLKTDVDTSKSTKQVGLEGRYEGKPELKQLEEENFTKEFVNKLKSDLANLDESNPDYEQMVMELQDAIQYYTELQQENGTEGSYERKYNNKAFREFVDARTSESSKPANYVATGTATPEVRATKARASSIKPGDRIKVNGKVYIVKDVDQNIVDSKGVITIDTIYTEEGPKFINPYRNKNYWFVDKVIEPTKPEEKKTETPVSTITPQQQESINKINKLIEDGKNATLVEETTEKESHYTLAGKLYQRVTQFFGNMIFDKAATVTNMMNAVVVGNYFDTFARMYYNNPNITIEQFIAELKNRPDYTQLSKIEVAKLFDDSKKYFSDIKEQIKKDLNDPNLVFITDNIFVHSTFKNDKWDGVAGTLDMVVVDSAGKIHIYDFKTKAENNAKYPVTKKSLEDTAFGDSYSQKWTKQQTAYSRLLKDSFGYTPNINIIVIPASYKLEEFKGDVKNSEDVKAFKPTPYDVAFTKTKPFIYGLTFDKDNKLVAVLDSVHTVSSDVEAKKADIEKRRQEELDNSLGEKITKNALKKANKPSKTKEQADSEIEKVKKENKELIDKLEDPNTTEEEWDKLADELGEKFRGTSNTFWFDKKDGKIKFAYTSVGKNGRINTQYSNAEPDSVGEYEVGDLLQVSNGSTNLPAKVTKVSSTGRVLEAKTDDGTVVIRNGFVLDANQVQANRVINAKYDAELKALGEPVIEPDKGDIQGIAKQGIIKVTANGYKALSIADNILVSDYLQIGNPAFYELEGSTGTTGKPRIQMVVYYNPKTKKFGQPIKGAKRIVIGQGFGKDPNNLSTRISQEINDSKDGRVQTRVEGLPVFNKRIFSTIVLGDIFVTLDKTKTKIYTIKKTIKSYDILDGQENRITSTDNPLQFIKNDLKRKLDNNSITKEEYDLYLDAVNESQSVKNRPKLSREDIKAMLPDMYVIGQSYASGESMVLLSKNADERHASYIDRFLVEYKMKYPSITDTDIEQIKNILNNPVNNGKVAFMKKNQVILFDTLTNRDYTPGKKLIEEVVETLTTGAKGDASWRVRVDDAPLSETVSKRSGIADRTSDKPNFRGRLVEFFSGGPSYRKREENKPESEQEIIYKIEYVEATEGEEGFKSSEIPVTKQQAIDELLDIRVQIHHEQLRTGTDDVEFIQKLSDVLRLPAAESADFAQVYNVVPLTPINNGGVQVSPEKAPQTPDQDEDTTVKVSSIPVVSPTKQETAITETEEELNGDEDFGDLKASEADLSGKVEEAVAYVSTRFEEIGVQVNDQVLRNLVKGTSKEGSKVWGAFHNAMVTLASNASETVGRHESAHVAEVMFHTDAQLKDLRQQMLSRWGKELGITKTKVSDLNDNELKAIREKFADTFEEYKNTLVIDNDSKFAKKYPAIAKFINNLFLFLKNNYMIGRSYITNKNSIDQVFYQIENNILGRDFLRRRKKTVRDTFQTALDNLEKPDFKVSNWGTKETYKFADFIANDLFTSFLQKNYSNISSINEVLGRNKDKNANILYDEFRADLKNTLDTYKAKIAKVKKFDTTSEAYTNFSDLLDDIYNQYNGEKLSKDFKFIVDKQLAKRYVKGGSYDSIVEDDLVAEQDDNENDPKDTSQENQLEAWQTKQGKIDAKTKSSARLREFFSSFPLRARVIKDDKSQRTTITDSLIFNNLYYKGEWIHNKLLVELSDNSNYEDFITSINDLVPKYQFAGDLIGAIMGWSEQEIMDAYDEGTLELPLDIIENADNYGGYKMWILKDIYQAISDQSNLNPLKTLTTSTKKQVTDTQVVTSVKETDQLNAKRSLNETITEKLKDKDKKEVLVDLLTKAVEAITSKGRTAGILKQLFAEMGYEASSELILHLQPTVSLYKYDNLTKLNMTLQEILLAINAGTDTVDIDGELDVLAKFISTYSTISSGLSYQNVENENEFAHKNGNYLTRVQAIWNKGVERRNQWVEEMTKVGKQTILGHFRNPFYEDFLNKKILYKIVVDGFIQTKDQSNSGKPYASYNKAEIIASSINAFLAKDNPNREANTIDSNNTDGTSLIDHALYHIQVYSDSPQRWFLQAPVFNVNQISDKLTQLVYGEMERIYHTKKGDMSKFEKMQQAGSMFQNIPELNDITFTATNGTTIKFGDLFTLDNWSDFNPNTLTSGLKALTYLSKTGESVTIPIDTTTYKNLLNISINTILKDNNANFKQFIAQEGVNTMIPLTATSESLDSYYFNSYYNNIVAQNVFGGDPANYKTNTTDYKTDIDIVKRTKQEISPNIKKLFKRPKFNIIVLQDIELETPYFQKKDKKTGEIVNVKANTTDAGAYHTIKRRREIMEADANWDLIGDEMGEIFDRINNNTYTKEDLQKLDLQPLKPFVYTQIIQQIPTTTIDPKTGKTVPGTVAVRVPIQLKDAEHVLLPTEAYEVQGQERYVRPTSLADIINGNYVRPDLAKLLYLMETPDKNGNTIDLAVFESGSKAEIFNKVNIDSADETTIVNSRVELNNSDWGIQQEVPRKDMQAKVGQGSQEHKIMSANVDPEWSFEYDGVIYDGQEGANEVLQLIQERNADANFMKALKKITNADGTLNVDKVLDILKEGVIEKSSNLETLEGLVRQTDGKTLIPVELLGKKGQQILNSILKKVSTFKVKGAALVNKPGFGYMGNRNNPNGYSDDLKLVTEKAADGSTIIKHWEAVVPVYDPIIYDYIDINGNLLTEKKIVDGKEVDVPLIPEKLLQAFFYRIPTEDKYSMFPIRIKRFSMPAQGGGIVLPREATETAGLDFDVDKLYGYYYNFKVKTAPELKDYVLKNYADSDKATITKYMDALDNGYADDIDMLKEQGLTVDDMGYIKNFSVTLQKYKSEFDVRFPQGAKSRTIDIHRSSLDTAEGTQNLKLDVYFSLTKTKAYGRDALKPGNKERLLTLRDKVLANTAKPNYSYADPVHVTNNATKNIVGKRLIGIFANANSFYNMIQGVARLTLRKPLYFTAGTTKYYFTTIGDVNPQISKNIAELLFASTEDVKDPVLEPLNINEITSSLLVTMLSLTHDDGSKIIKFEDAITLLSDPSIIQAVKLVQKNGGKLKDVYKGPYKNLIDTSDAYNSIISASKIDQELGPDFYTIQSKLDSIDSIFDASMSLKYPFETENIEIILPSIYHTSKIKQLNVYRKALEKELNMFSEVYSFLTPVVKKLIDRISEVSKNKKLNPKIRQKFSYMTYDAAIQGYLNSTGKLEELKANFPKRLKEYTFPERSGILQQAFEVKNNVVKMRWVNISASDILTQYQNAFTDLFISDPEMATDLATYGFLTGTNFSMDSIVKIVPNVYYKTDEGQIIRDIINGKKLGEYLRTLTNPFESLLYNNFTSILNKLEEPTQDKDTKLYYSNTPMEDKYVYIREKTGNILLEKVEEAGEDGYVIIHRQVKGELPNYILNPSFTPPGEIETEETYDAAPETTTEVAPEFSEEGNALEFDFDPDSVPNLEDPDGGNPPISDDDVDTCGPSKPFTF